MTMSFEKLYTENQYTIYSDYLDKIANEPVIADNALIYFEMVSWIEENNISNIAIEQMDERMMLEDSNAIPKLKRIK